jgi:hypothetical protein
MELFKAITIKQKTAPPAKSGKGGFPFRYGSNT